ncbi:MAG: CehA/McbA family metallohydrolase [Alphaproteobacteria bacterium]|nr:CehA/McbA family metallohydrolase [Alphaproteobacteria bacterium]
MRHALILVLSACATEVSDPTSDTDTAPTPPACAWEARAHAGLLAAGDWVPEGPDALARPGDALLANPHAAFVIQGPDDPRTYYHYGGIPLDAVPLDGCTQTAPEQFGEVGILPAQLDLLDFSSSSMRQFRADTVEVVSDGRDGGPAHVRFTGVDDRFWLVDHALTRQAAGSGRRRPLSGPMGIALTVDYRLAPDQPVLEVEITVRNTTDAPNQVFVGALMFPSDLTPWQVYTEDDLSFGGFSLQVGVPWFAMSSGASAYAFAMDTTNMAWTNVSGANALLDAASILDDASTLEPAGELGDSVTARWWIAVGAGAENTATSLLQAVRPEINGTSYDLRRVQGRVEGADEEAVVEVLRTRRDGSTRVFDQLRTASDGSFEGLLPDAGTYALRARAGQHDPSPALELPGGEAVDLALQVGPVGQLRVAATDGSSPMPALVSLYEGERRRFTFYAPPGGAAWEVPPGTWDVSITRGYEFDPVHTTVEVVEGATVELTPALPRLVDTAGWLSVDGHVHTAPSPDSDVLPETRFATAATAGLEVMVQTDHEIVVDLSKELAASPWSGFLATILGEEVTATSPEHLNMWGITVSPDDGPRGNPVRWYGRDIAQLYDDMRARGAAVVQLNHPGWMDAVRYDPLTGTVLETDPTLLGFEPGQALWSWDFDAIELQNGFKRIFGASSRPGSGGLFRSWQSFFNHGHRITAVGVSDVHGLRTPGEARTYVPSPEGLDAFVEGPVLQAVQAGRAVVSTGAFAQVHVGNATAGFDATLGDTVTLPGDDVVVRLEVQALPSVRVDRVAVFANCDLVATVVATAPDGVVKATADVPLTLAQDAHLVVVAAGSGAYPRGLDTPGDKVARAITNPVFVDVDGNGVFDPPGGKDCDLGWLSDG